MLYRILKIGAKLALPLFVRRIEISNPQALQTRGPLLLAVNHPNSFFDAILLGAFMQHPVHFISRGDVFNNATVRKMLAVLNMIPIYRMRDGKEKLSLNQETFLRSEEVLKNNGILLIFVEGFCENQTTLQLPLKKGAPRILQSCWQQGVHARVLPVWLQYSSFNRIGKTIHIRLGEVFGNEIGSKEIESATTIAKINAETCRQLLHQYNLMPFEHKALPLLTRSLLFIPAMFGAVLHAPVYLPIQAFCKQVNKGTVHYDSILFSVLLIVYPIALVVLASVLFSLTGLWWFFPVVLLGLPLLAWCYIKWKP